MKNILNFCGGFFDDLDKLNPNQDDGFNGINRDIYDEHDYILSPYKNPEFFYGLCNMYSYFDNKIGFTQEDLDQITYMENDFNAALARNPTGL